MATKNSLAYRITFQVDADNPLGVEANQLNSGLHDWIAESGIYEMDALMEKLHDLDISDHDFAVIHSRLEALENAHNAAHEKQPAIEQSLDMSARLSKACCQAYIWARFRNNHAAWNELLSEEADELCATILMIEPGNLTRGALRSLEASYALGCAEFPNPDSCDECYCGNSQPETLILRNKEDGRRGQYILCSNCEAAYATGWFDSLDKTMPIISEHSGTTFAAGWETKPFWNPHSFSLKSQHTRKFANG